MTNNTLLKRKLISDVIFILLGIIAIPIIVFSGNYWFILIPVIAIVLFIGIAIYHMKTLKDIK